MTSNLGIISDPEPPKKEHVYKNITVQILHNKYISFGTKLHVYNAHGFHIGACNHFVLVSLYRNLDRYCSP